MTHPKVTFYPADLDFFIRFELRGRARRQKLPSTVPSTQRVPTAKQYIQRRGLYRRVFFRYNRTDREVGWVPEGTPNPAPWRGSPIASLRRAMAVLTSPRGGGISPDDHQKLFLLWRLYFRRQQGADAEEEAAYQYRGDEGNDSFGLGDDYQWAGSEPENDFEEEEEKERKVEPTR
ncbi:hypothetical protein BDW74DRAFT_21863 [Aspergillus multicolor]|uniref:uncharacterized protein n=1 Tax=Aspergillus multicolor TaxID=41759 RepID=UPI003CCDE39A